MMIGVKTSAKNSIQPRLYSLPEAFHTVRLWLGLVVEGIRKGNMLALVVKIAPIQPIAPSHHGEQQCQSKHHAEAHEGE